MIYLLLRLLVTLLIFMLVSGLCYQLFKYVSTEHKAAKNIRNYQVRFEPDNNKYFIVNQLPSGDVPVMRWYGRRIFYTNRADAQFVVNKLNPSIEAE